MDNSIHHLGSFEADLEVRGVHFIILYTTNDGIVSTASLLVGVAAADTTKLEILLAGTAGLVAGAMSMAATAAVGSFFGISEGI
jgi:VIT1/CCC1 family predicted Fe2+/Mn2+ transporter